MSEGDIFLFRVKKNTEVINTYHTSLLLLLLIFVVLSSKLLVRSYTFERLITKEAQTFRHI